MVAIPDLLARLLKYPVDLLHDTLCPCRGFNHMETAELESHPASADDRPGHPFDGPRVGRDVP